MRVRIVKAQLDHFRRKARSSRREIMAILVGEPVCFDNHKTTRIDVVRFIYPPLEKSDGMQVIIGDAEIRKIEEAARRKNLRVVGAIHSHPNDTPIMSEQDFSAHIAYGDAITGIVSVFKKRTRVMFWSMGSPLPCNLEYYQP